MLEQLEFYYRDNTRFQGHDHLRALKKSVPARVRSTRAGTDFESARRHEGRNGF
jgi:hypothetical protein